MVYKKYITRDGKKFGPYYFKSVRTPDGKVKSVYLGTKNPEKKKVPFAMISIAVALLFVFGFFGMFAYQGFNVADVFDGSEEIKTNEDISENIESIDEEVGKQEGTGESEEEKVEGLVEDEKPIEEEVVINLNENEESELNIDEEELVVEDIVLNKPTLEEHSDALNAFNQTLESEDFEKNVSLLHYDVVIYKPVRWEKKVELGKLVNELKIKLPKEAINVSITKIQSEERGISELDERIPKEEEKTPEIKNKNLEKPNLITGNVVADFSFNEFFKNFFNNLFTGFVVFEGEQTITIEGPLKGAKVEYYLPGPTTKEKQITNNKKQITVSSKYHYENVLTHTKINNTPLESINLYHLNKENKTREKTNFIGHDKDQDGLIDYIEWITPHLSDETYELEITILNVQSYPELGGNWTIGFNTSGVANLSITAFNGTTWEIVENNNSDLQFLDLRCGNESVVSLWENGMVFVENYSCSGTGWEISKVLTAEKHYLKFQFGDQIAYAYNDVLSCGQSISGYVLMENDITGCTGDGLNLASNTVLDCNNHLIDGDAVDDGADGVDVAWGVHNVTVKNCIIQQFTNGIFSNGNDNQYINNTIKEIYDWGIYIYGSENATVINNSVHTFLGTNDRSGIRLRGASYSLISGNNLTGANSDGAGITATSAVAPLVTHTNISNNVISEFDYGIVGYTYFLPGNNRVENNTIFDADLVGISFGNVNATLIYNNNVYSTDASQDSGISLTGTTTRVNISGNRVSNHSGSSQDGIIVSSNTNGGVVIENNILYKNFYGIYLNGADWVNVTGNVVSNATEVGIIAYGSAHNNRYVNNTVCYNFDDGSSEYSFYVRDSNNNTYINNTANYSRSYGFYNNNADNTNITNFYSFGPATGNVYFTSSQNGTLDGVNASGGTYPLYLNSADNITVKNSYFDGTYGMLWVNGDYTDVTNVVAKGGASQDLRFAGSTANNYVTFLNVSYNDINWGTDPTYIIHRWYLDVKVNDSNGVDIVGANVSAIDVNAVQVFDEDTTNMGWIPRQNLTERYLNRTNTYGYLTNYTVNVSHIGYGTDVQDINLTDNTVHVVTFFGNTVPPAFSKIELNSSSELNTTDENLTVYFTTSSDIDGDEVFNITDWRVNDTSIALLNMPFDRNVSNSNGTIKDFSSYENNGTLGNSTSGVDPVWQNGTDCKVGGCYHFDGDNDFIQLTEDYSLLDGGSIMGWMKFDDLDSDHGLVNLGLNPKEELTIWMDENGASDRFGIALFGPTGWTVEYGSTVPDTISWWHVTFVYSNESGNYSQLFVNGVQEGNNLTGDGLRDVVSSSWRIGIGDNGMKQHAGDIDEFKIFDRALSPEQVYKIYSEEFNNHSVQTFISEETEIGDNWTVALTPSDLEDYGDTTLSNGLVILEVQNNAPATPTPAIDSLDGTNTTNQDLNCSDSISDPDSNDLNVTVRWYKDNNLHLEFNDDNSGSLYSSGTDYTTLLGSDNTTEGSKWFCSMVLFDGKLNSSWGNSSNLTVKNNPNTYYVSKGGNDANDGSSWSDSWLTLEKADTSAPAHSLIYVGDGEYAEDSGGWAGYWYFDGDFANKTYISMNRSKAVIVAADSGASRVVRIVDRGNNMTLVGFTINGNNSRAALNVDGSGGWKKMINNTFINFTSAVILIDNNMHFEGNTFNGTYFKAFNGISANINNLTIINNTFLGNVTDGIVIIDRPIAEVKNVVIKYNFFHNTSGVGYGPIYFNKVNASTFTIEHNIFGTPEIPQEDISINLKNVTGLTINNNTFWAGNFSDHYSVIYLPAGGNNSNLRIINNRMGNSTNYVNLEGGGFFRGTNVSGSIFENNSLFQYNGTGIDIRSRNNGQTEDVIIRNNTLQYNYCEYNYGIKVGADDISNGAGDIKNTIIENNSIVLPRLPCNQHSLFTGRTNNTRVRNNYVDGSGYGILSKHDSNYYAYNNIMVNQTIFYSFVTRSGHNISFHNNTVYANHWNNTNGPDAFQMKNDDDPERNVTNVTSYDNIFYLFNTSYAYKVGENGINFSKVNFTSWNNTFWVNKSSQDFATEGTDDYSFQGFRESFGEYVEYDDSIFSAWDEIPAIDDRYNVTGYTSVLINWTTQESANTTIEYGTDASLGSSSGNSSFVLEHSLNITGLGEYTTYYFNITSCDYENNCNDTGIYNFTTGSSNSAPPALSKIILNSSSNLNTTDENLTVYFTTIADDDGDEVFNITDWRVNDTSIALVNMPFDRNVSNSNGTIKDFSSYENNGTLGNSTSGVDPVWQNGTDCKVGGCYHFDGGVDFDSENDFIQLSDEYNLLDGGTIMGWMKFDDLDRDHALVNLADSGKEKLVVWMDENGAEDRFAIALYGPGWSAEYGSTVPDTSSWWHVTFVYSNESGNYSQLFVNGIQEGNNLTGKGLRDIAGPSWRVGLGDNGGKAHNGSIDEFKIFDRALSPEQVYKIYSEEFNNHSVQTFVSEETAIGDNWTVALTPSDLEDYGDTTLSNGVVIANIPPSIPILITPTNGNTSVINRTTFFDWEDSTDDEVGDSLTYRIVVADDELLTSVIFNESSATGGVDSDYIYPDQLDVDSILYWRVEVTDTKATVVSEVWNFTISSYVDISLLTSTVNFGVMGVSENDNTTDSVPPPFEIMNSGNVLMDINISATQLFTLSDLDNESYQFKVSESEATSFNLTDSLTDWTFMPTGMLTAIFGIDYTGINDTAYGHINITVPASESVGGTDSNITFMGFMSG